MADLIVPVAVITAGFIGTYVAVAPRLRAINLLSDNIRVRVSGNESTGRINPPPSPPEASSDSDASRIRMHIGIMDSTYYSAIIRAGFKPWLWYP